MNNLTHGGISWEQFTKINQAFDGIGGLRLNYCEGVLEILPISKTPQVLNPATKVHKLEAGKVLNEKFFRYK